MKTAISLTAALLLCAPPVHAQADASWREAAIAAASDWHRQNTPATCDLPAGDPSSVDLLPIGEDTAAREALLIGFPCNAAAYNASFVFLLSDDRGRVSEVTFPAPKPEVTWADPEEKTTVTALSVAGIGTTRQVVNAVYDAAGRTMRAYDKWRGVGDAFSITTWGFTFGRFEIMKYEVDASYDGVENPQTLIEEEIW